jgi:hypothetical protein
MKPPSGGAAFPLRTSIVDGQQGVNTFRKTTPAKSVMFMVNYDDGRTPSIRGSTILPKRALRAVGLIDRAQQEQGSLPKGSITRFRRVR